MRSRKSFGWLELLLGALLVVGGALTLRNPGAAMTTFVIVYAIAAIVGGIVDIVFYVRLERRTGFGPVFSIISGILSIAVGIMLLFNIGAGAVALSILFPIWFIVHCIARLANLNYVKSVFGNGYFWLSLIVNILGLVVGFILLFNLGLSAATLVMFIAYYLLLLGIGAIISGIAFLVSKD